MKAGLVKVKKKRISARDVQKNMLEIDHQMKWANGEIHNTIEQMKACDKNKEEGQKKFEELQTYLTGMMDLYSALQEEQEKELTILKKYKDSKFLVPPLQLATLVVVSGITFITIALERENPNMIKKVSFIVGKMFPIKF